MVVITVYRTRNNTIEITIYLVNYQQQWIDLLNMKNIIIQRDIITHYLKKGITL